MVQPLLKMTGRLIESIKISLELDVAFETSTIDSSVGSFKQGFTVAGMPFCDSSPGQL